MSAFWKVLVGDTQNLLIVLAIVAAAALLARAGFARESALLVPLLLLGGVAWLARR